MMGSGRYTIILFTVTIFLLVIWLVIHSVQEIYLPISPGTDLQQKTRNIMKKVLIDKMQMLFNYEGRGMKNKDSLKKFPALLSVVYRM